MLRTVFTTLATVAVLNAGLAAAAPVTARSSGAAFNFTFDVNGSAATLLNQVYAAGSAPPAYNVKKPQAKFYHIKTYPNHLAVTTIHGIECRRRHYGRLHGDNRQGIDYRQIPRQHRCIVHRDEDLIQRQLQHHQGRCRRDQG
jgi:hypothetical protein